MDSLVCGMESAQECAGCNMEDKFIGYTWYGKPVYLDKDGKKYTIVPPPPNCSHDLDPGWDCAGDHLYLRDDIVLHSE